MEIGFCLYMVNNTEGEDSRVFEDSNSSLQNIKIKCFLLFHFLSKEYLAEEEDSLINLIGTLSLF